MTNFARTTALGLLLGTLAAAERPAPPRPDDASAPTSVAITAHRDDWSDNAALVYWRATVFMRDDPKWMKALEQKGPGSTEPMPAEAALEKDQALMLLHHGAAMAAGTFGYRSLLKAEGPNVLLPEIGEMKALANRCRYRAIWRFEHGRDGEAVEDCLAIVALGADMARDSALMNRLVAIHIQGIGFSALKRFLPSCGPEACRIIAVTLGDARHNLPPLAQTMEAESLVAEWCVQHGDDPWVKQSLKGLEESDVPRALTWLREQQGVHAVVMNEADDLPTADFKSRLATLADSEKTFSDQHPGLAKLILPYGILMRLERRHLTAQQLLIRAAAAMHSPQGLMSLAGVTLLGGTLTVKVVDKSTVFTWDEEAGSRPFVIGEPLAKPATTE